MMHQSEFDAANVALSRAADKRKYIIMPRVELRRHTVVVLSVCLSVTSISRRSLKTKS